MQSPPNSTARFTQGCLIAAFLFGALATGALLAIASANPLALATYLAMTPFLAWGGWKALNRVIVFWKLRPYREAVRALGGAQATVDAVPSGPPDRSGLFEDAEALRDEYRGSLKPRLVKGEPHPSTFDTWLRRQKQQQQEYDARLAWYTLDVSVTAAPSQQHAAWNPHWLSLFSPDAVLTGWRANLGGLDGWELEDMSVWDPGAETFRGLVAPDLYGSHRLRCLAGIAPDRRTLKLVYANVLPLADVEFPPHAAPATTVPDDDAGDAPPPTEAIADGPAERTPLQFNMFSMLLMMAVPGLLAFLFRLAGLEGVPLAGSTLLCSLGVVLCIIFYKALG